MSVDKLTISQGHKGPEKLQINKSKKIITGEIKAFNIKDGSKIVIYVPSLNISGYGSSFEQAIDMLKEIIDDYFRELVKLKPENISIELKKYGWEKTIFHKRFEQKVFIDKDGVLKNFELPEDTKIEETMLSF